MGSHDERKLTTDPAMDAELLMSEGKNKVTITMRLDPDVLAFAKARGEEEGAGYQTWINDTLRRLMEGQVRDDRLAALEERVSSIEKVLKQQAKAKAKPKLKR